MKEFQFVMRAWVDVMAETREEAVAILNAAFQELEQPMRAPAPLLRLQVDTGRPATEADIAGEFDMATMRWSEAGDAASRVCEVCGIEFEVSETGVATHVGGALGVDHDLDADHVPFGPYGS
jgi:hypothetical protein